MTNSSKVTEEEDLLVRASKYANYLKEKQLESDGIDVNSLRGLRKGFYADLENSSFEEVSNQATLQSDKDAYEKISVQED